MGGSAPSLPHNLVLTNKIYCIVKKIFKVEVFDKNTGIVVRERYYEKSNAARCAASYWAYVYENMGVRIMPCTKIDMFISQVRHYMGTDHKNRPNNVQFMFVRRRGRLSYLYFHVDNSFQEYEDDYLPTLTYCVFTYDTREVKRLGGKVIGGMYEGEYRLEGVNAYLMHKDVELGILKTDSYFYKAITASLSDRERNVIDGTMECYFPMITGYENGVEIL